MTTPLQGLGGLRGFVKEDAFASATDRNGDVADPRHAAPNLGADHPYPWEQYPGTPHGPYGIENDMLGFPVDDYTAPAGYIAQDPTADLQPVTHAANWPKGVPMSVQPDEVAARRVLSAEIHAQNEGGSREALYLPTMNPVQDEWVEIWEVDPGVLIPSQPEMPAQLKGTGIMGWGSTDRNATFARQNGYGFDSAHMHRRYAAGSIPGNYMWMQPGGRPLVKSTPGAALIQTGGDSPFAGQDGALGYDAHGSVLMAQPSEYIPPPTPALAPAMPGEDGIVEFW